MKKYIPLINGVLRLIIAVAQLGLWVLLIGEYFENGVTNEAIFYALFLIMGQIYLRERDVEYHEHNELKLYIPEKALKDSVKKKIKKATNDSK